MATASVSARESETAVRRFPLSSARIPVVVARLVPAVVLIAALDSPCDAATPIPGMPTDAAERAWYTTFMTRFNARVVPSFQIDRDLEARVAQVWDQMVQRIAGGRGTRPTPLDQYPLLSFVDDQFLVMKIKTPRGRDSYVVRDGADGQMPTLGSTLEGYLDDVIYPSLMAIAEDEKAKLESHPDYEPRLAQLSAQNPFQHGLPIRVPDMGPFKNRMVVFTGYGKRLSAADTAVYEQEKWDVGERKIVGVVRDHRWGVAVEFADLTEAGEVVCHYRAVREVSAVKDTFVGVGRRGVLLRQPRLGAVVEVSGCTGECDASTGWRRIYPEVDAKAATASPGHQALPPTTPGAPSAFDGQPPRLPPLGPDSEPPS